MLCAAARDIGFAKASSPLFIWSSWVAARVLFSKSTTIESLSALTTVHAFLNHLPGPDDDFEAILAALKDQAQYWSLASEFWPNNLALGFLHHSACLEVTHESGIY